MTKVEITVNSGDSILNYRYFRICRLDDLLNFFSNREKELNSYECPPNSGLFRGSLFQAVLPAQEVQANFGIESID